MSLETVLTDLTTAVRELTVALNASRGTAIPAPSEIPAPEAEKKTRKTKTPTPEPEKAPDAKAEVVAPTKEDHEKEAEPIIQELLNKGKKQAILDLNKKYGVARFREICGTDKFDAFMAEAKKLLEAA